MCKKLFGFNGLQHLPLHPEGSPIPSLPLVFPDTLGAPLGDGMNAEHSFLLPALWW